MNRNGSKDKRYWFPAKKYGWGWDMPHTTEGALVLLGYVVAMVLGSVFLPPIGGQALWWGGYVVLITALLLVICLKTGEPPAWRWGDKGKARPRPKSEE